MLRTLPLARVLQVILDLLIALRDSDIFMQVNALRNERLLQRLRDFEKLSFLTDKILQINYDRRFVDNNFKIEKNSKPLIYIRKASD